MILNVSRFEKTWHTTLTISSTKSTMSSGPNQSFFLLNDLKLPFWSCMFWSITGGTFLDGSVRTFRTVTIESNSACAVVIASKRCFCLKKVLFGNWKPRKNRKRYLKENESIPPIMLLIALLNTCPMYSDSIIRLLIYLKSWRNESRNISSIWKERWTFSTNKCSFTSGISVTVFHHFDQYINGWSGRSLFK